ncbi:trans-sialidase [Trypanosoma cruzi Dm28c]|uniref:Trans-sialidase n=1 Tax=Trypanosoma cruzi Dm28c TaxID=1416333 RepID=V5A347_TRYCR|nr:trans-sialidase [Trypanosoma cruzi Dm28c]
MGLKKMGKTTLLGLSYDNNMRWSVVNDLFPKHFTAWELDKTYHVVLKMHDGVGSVYVDGTLLWNMRLRNSFNEGLDEVSHFYFGAYDEQLSSRKIHATVANVFLYNRPLNETEIGALNASKVAISPPERKPVPAAAATSPFVESASDTVATNTQPTVPSPAAAGPQPTDQATLNASSVPSGGASSTPAESESEGPKPAESESAEPKSAEPKSAEPKSAEPKSAEPKSAEPKSAEPKSAEPKSAEPKSAEPKSAEPKSAEPKSGEFNAATSSAREGTADQPASATSSDGHGAVTSVTSSGAAITDLGAFLSDDAQTVGTEGGAMMQADQPTQFSVGTPDAAIATTHNAEGKGQEGLHPQVKEAEAATLSSSPLNSSQRNDDVAGTMRESGLLPLFLLLGLWGFAAA